MPDATHSPHDGPLRDASRSGSLVAFPHTHTRPPNNNLPLELASFVGRGREIAEVNRRVIGHDGYLEEAHWGLMRSQAALGERG